MSDRASHLRDRTLVLRILVPSLQAALQDKMTEREEDAAERRVAESQSRAGGGGPAPGAASSPKAPTSQVLELDGVSCEPAEDGSTLWHFHCDGASYPARLVNLPCPVELHKTFDHATYYKCSDVGQILIVYEDETHLEEAESVPGYKTEGYPSYYHSGLTPPMKRVVQRRFNAREHNSVAPPRSEVSAVERELRELIDKTTKDAKGKGKAAAQSGAGQAGKVLEEVVEDVVEYEPWMDDNGRVPYGVEFDEKDVMCTKHPEVWLDPNAVKEEERLLEQKRAQEEEEKARRAAEAAAANAAAAAAAAASAAASKKAAPKAKGGGKSDKGGKSGGETTTTTTKKKKKKKKDPSAEKPSSPTPDGHKKGIAAKKNREQVDEVTQAATQIAKGLDTNEDADLAALEGLFDFSAEGDDTFEGMDFS